MIGNPDYTRRAIDSIALFAPRFAGSYTTGGWPVGLRETGVVASGSMNRFVTEITPAAEKSMTDELEPDQKRFLVTGGAGFLGSHVVRHLRETDAAGICVPRQRQYDLTRETDVERLLGDNRPDVVIHLAAEVGGIAANGERPGEFFYKNLMMGALLMEHSRRAGVEKFVGVGTICAYPSRTPVPFREETLWDGYPEPTNAPYGLAKKMLLVQGQAYRRQYGFGAIHLLPVNLYGPGDNFDPQSSHVIPALIRKCVDAIDQGQSQIVCWGDGTATREFLYVEDAARAIVAATRRYNGAAPVNIGSCSEISIADLAALIAELTGFHGRIRWDASRPNGQARRCVDVRKAREEFGFEAAVGLGEGLRATIDWWRNRRASSGALGAKPGRLAGAGTA